MTQECLSYLTPEEQLLYWDFIGLITVFQNRGILPDDEKKEEYVEDYDRV
jgi:hypothetical protein